ncbi:MAG: CopD family protein [Roseiarcus sp.]
MIIGMTLHTLAAVIWVGGMFFAHMVLRPSAGPLEPAVRMALWSRVFPRFFFWVWLSVAALLVTGFGMVLLGLGGFAAVGGSVHAMTALGVVMAAIFATIYFAPWPRFRHAVSTADWPSAETNLRTIRLLVTVNLTLGLVTTAIGASGPYFG